MKNQKFFNAFSGVRGVLKKNFQKYLDNRLAVCYNGHSWNGNRGTVDTLARSLQPNVDDGNN